MKWLLTGAAGFIGTHLTRYLTEAGETCLLTDNFHRGRRKPGIDFLDVRYQSGVDSLLENNPDIDVIAHLAGQVSLVASIGDPRYDFETNAHGTFNLLDAARRLTPHARFIFASTNKVYGDLRSLSCLEDATRYTVPDHPKGFTEELPIELHGGYSCSKGAADQYVRDYFRVYGLKTVCLRQSTIYGGNQYATEDQGWVAWFVRMAAEGSPFRISGNGKQVRDLLHVSDLCACLRILAEKSETSPVWGEALNIGGGADRSLSLLELFAILRKRFGLTVDYTAGPPRVGDQKVFVADTSRALKHLGWAPSVPVEHGLDELVRWSLSQWHAPKVATCV